MATELKMPALSPTMEEGTLAKWLVKEGDDVKSGDILAEIETDKATMEFEAVDEGKIAKILVPEGTDGVKVGQPIALLAADGETLSDVAPPAAPQHAASEPAATQDPEGVEIPASQQDEVTPTPYVFETAARDLVADVAHTRDEPEVPEGTLLVSMTLREALRDAMAEETRADDRVFVLGEEVAEYQGAYKVTQGLLDEFGPSGSSIRQSPSMASLALGQGSDGGPAPHRRIHDLQIRDAGYRRHHQLGREDEVLSGGRCAARLCSGARTGRWLE